MLQSRFHVGKKTLNVLKKTATFFTYRNFDRSFYHTVVYFLLIYAGLTIFAENLLLLHPLIARLSTETAAAFFAFRLHLSPACLFLDSFRCSLLLLVAVIFTVVSLSVIRCRPSRPFIHSVLLLPPSPCNSVIYFAILLPLSHS